MENIKIKMRDVRAAKMCSRGARDFFKRNNLDWKEFLNNGVDSNDLILTKDSMAIHVIEVAKNGRK